MAIEYILVTRDGSLKFAVARSILGFLALSFGGHTCMLHAPTVPMQMFIFESLELKQL